METTKVDELHICTHPKDRRFIQEYFVWGRQKTLVMCRDCGKLVETIIIEKNETK